MYECKTNIALNAINQENKWNKVKQHILNNGNGICGNKKLDSEGGNVNMGAEFAHSDKSVKLGTHFHRTLLFDKNQWKHSGK